MTESFWLYTAASISTLTLLAHIFGGGKSIAKPVLDSDLDNEPKYASYYCWHMVTIVIAFMAVCFVFTALAIASVDLAIAATVLAGLFTLWSIFLTVWKKQTVLTLPQWILFLPIAISGYLGI